MIHVPNKPELLLVSFRGPMGSGKTTAADVLVNEFGFSRLSFAQPLKKLAQKITPDGLIDKVRDRALLQFLGTEYFRALDPDHWVNQWEKAIADRVELNMGQTQIVVDDCRFPNEAEAVERLGGHEIFLETPREHRSVRLVARDGVLNLGITGHTSESPLPLGGGCRVVVNSGDVLELKMNLTLEMNRIGVFKSNA
jgi:dephospho-CoA kinase